MYNSNRSKFSWWIVPNYFHFSIQLGNGETGTDVRVRNNRLHCQNCYSNDEGKQFQPNCLGGSTLLISLISTNFLLTCFAHHTLFLSYFYLNGDFSFFRFKVHFLSVFHSLLIHLMHFQVWNSAKFRAQSQSIQYSQNSLTRKKVFKLVVRNKAVSNSNSWFKIYIVTIQNSEGR